MNLRRLIPAMKLGFTLAKPGNIESIHPKTAAAANTWAIDNGLGYNIPFPFLNQGTRQLGKDWLIPDQCWGWVRVGLQVKRQFWIEHSNGKTSKWINGRVKPEVSLGE